MGADEVGDILKVFLYPPPPLERESSMMVVVLMIQNVFVLSIREMGL